jgi:hypothetical protein
VKRAESGEGCGISVQAHSRRSSTSRVSRSPSTFQTSRFAKERRREIEKCRSIAIDFIVTKQSRYATGYASIGKTAKIGRKRSKINRGLMLFANNLKPHQRNPAASSMQKAWSCFLGLEEGGSSQ